MNYNLAMIRKMSRKTLIGVCAIYLGLIPFSIASYMKVRRARVAAGAPTQG